MAIEKVPPIVTESVEEREKLKHGRKQGVPPKKVLDLRGTHKTVSVNVLVQVVEALTFLSTGESIELLTDDYTGLQHDIEAWGRISGNSVQKSDQVAWDHYVITKQSSSLPKQRMAIVLSSNALDELISPLGFALAAATAGMETNLFFQGPAVHVLEKGFLGRLSSPFQAPFSIFARRGMAAMGHDPPAIKLQQLHDLGAKFYACHPSLDHFGVKESQIAFDDVILAEYMTFLEVMRDANVQMYP